VDRVSTFGILRVFVQIRFPMHSHRDDLRSVSRFDTNARRHIIPDVRNVKGTVTARREFSS